MLRSSIAIVALIAATAATAADLKVLTSKDPSVAWKTIQVPGGDKKSYTIGLGSAAFRHPSDPTNVIWTGGDRGPNMTCKAAAKLLSKEISELCKTQKKGRVYPTPEYVPSIYKIEMDVDAGTFKVVETITLKTKSGKPISGLLNPQTVATKDTGVDMTGKVLADSADNVDLEGLVKLTDGTFWIGEEMGPSIAHVTADGRIVKRFVPANAADDYKDADTEIVASLPEVLSKRQGNRGIESMAISPDEKFLYFMVQNPLANPDAKTYQAAKNTRIFKMERESGKLVGEYVYQLDDPQTFALDPSDKQNSPRVSELTALGLDRLLVLERTNGTTKLHEITLEGATNILGTKWDKLATTPTLEAENDLTKLDLKPVSKTLRFDTARDMKEAPTKLEGVAFMADGTMVLINDNDFGIAGADTKIVLVKGAVTADEAVYKK